MTKNMAGESAELLFEQGKHFYLASQGHGGDPHMAEAYFRRAAELGFAPAWRLLGMMHLEGRGVNKDLKTAYRLLKSAAELGDPQASFSLALMLAQGNGVEKNWAEAYRLLTIPEVAAIPEASELKRRLKEKLIGLYPDLTEALRREETLLRTSLTRTQSRFIPGFLEPGRCDDDRVEFEAWLSLNLGQSSVAEIFPILTAQLKKYYQAMIDRHPDAGILKP
ncbi:MAG: sel1 repeat family protein [Deltaproteobacteria bacterium]|jgi:hypothetical protein|nr:sel1 repeat family protein [Deltaproteobacteria bacterium]